MYWQKYIHLANLWINVALVALPAMIAVFGLVALSLLLLGQFHTAYVSLLGVVSCGLVLYVVWRQQKGKPYYELDRKDTLFRLLAILFVVFWVGWNLNHNSEHVFVNRDPGIYVVTAKILQNEPNLAIDKVDALHEGEGYFSSAAGFDTSRIDNSELFAQGAHLLPALLGFTSRFFGDEAIFNSNVLLGGLALIVFYGFSVKYMRARFAFLGMVSLGLLLPFIYFSRDTYTEILALMFTFGALTLIHFALNRKSLPLWFIAGLTLGAGVMTRIDGYISIAAMIVFVCAWLVLAKTKKERYITLKQIWFLVAGTFVTALIGFLDVKILASGYFASEWRYLSLELYLLAALIIMSSVIVLFFWKNKRILDRINRYTERWRPWAGVGVIIIFWLFVGSRFLWMNNPPQTKVAEMMVPFMGAYLGPLMLALGIAGLSLMAYNILKSKSYMMQFMPFFIVVITTAFLYVTKPSISSDHVWASRRVLPIVLPGLIFAGLYIIHLLYQRNKKNKNTKNNAVLTTLVIVAVLSPLVLTHRFATLSSFKQNYAIEAVCNQTPEKSLIIWLGRAGMDAPLATRAFCGNDSVRYKSTSEPITNSKLATAQEAAYLDRKDLYIGLYDDDVDLLPENSETTFVVERITENVELTYRRPPINKIVGRENILIGIVDEKGNINKIKGDDYETK